MPPGENTLPPILRSRLIKYFIFFLVVLLFILTFLPYRAKGDQIAQVQQTAPDVIIPSPTASTPPKQGILPHSGGVGDRVTRIRVPEGEALRITALIMATFPDNQIMVKVAIAESGLDCGIKNPGSSARGCFQILTSTWKSEQCVGNVLVAEDNIACAKKLFDRYGTNPWNESKASWGK